MSSGCFQHRGPLAYRPIDHLSMFDGSTHTKSYMEPQNCSLCSKVMFQSRVCFGVHINFPANIIRELEDHSFGSYGSKLAHSRGLCEVGALFLLSPQKDVAFFQMIFQCIPISLSSLLKPWPNRNDVDFPMNSMVDLSSSLP